MCGVINDCSIAGTVKGVVDAMPISFCSIESCTIKTNVGIAESQPTERILVRITVPCHG